MVRQNRILVWLLRAIGTLDFAAIQFVFAPRDWLAGIHQWLGLGDFPQHPIVGYLARSTSIWYAIYGLLLWFVSFDVQKYALLIRVLAATLVIQGLIIASVGAAEGLPIFWIMSEGTVCSTMGLALLWVQHAPSHDDSQPPDVR